MKKRLLKLFLWVAGLVVIIIILNFKVTTKQGINYNVQTLKIPLYLKVLDFFDRHYNYEQLVRTILSGVKTDHERVTRIFEWTYNNIKRAPEGLPIIDDHVWYIIVRGYGVSDQFCDVFAALCNYAEVEVYYSWVYTTDCLKRIPLSFVRIDGEWTVFDPYRGIYFKNKNGHLATLDEIKNNNWQIERIGAIEKLDIDYKDYFINLSSMKRARVERSNIQSPFRRFIFELNKLKRL